MGTSVRGGRTISQLRELEIDGTDVRNSIFGDAWQAVTSSPCIAPAEKLDPSLDNCFLERAACRWRAWTMESSNLASP